jgi:hypothetical protein
MEITVLVVLASPSAKLHFLPRVLATLGFKITLQ